jgi:hypothetical protein
MLRDERGCPRPRRESEQSLDETSADQSASAVSLVAPSVAESFKLHDQGGDFGGVEKYCDVANYRATRYFARCHGRSLSLGHAPGSLRFAGALLFGFAGKSYSWGRTA